MNEGFKDMVLWRDELLEEADDRILFHTKDILNLITARHVTLSGQIIHMLLFYFCHSLNSSSSSMIR